MKKILEKSGNLMEEKVGTLCLIDFFVKDVRCEILTQNTCIFVTRDSGSSNKICLLSIFPTANVNVTSVADRFLIS